MRKAWPWFCNSIKGIFLILFPIMCCLFIYVLVHRDRIHSDHRITVAQSQAIKIANDKILATQYKACLRGVKLRAAVDDAHGAIYSFMTAAIQAVERRSKLEGGAKRQSDLKALSEYKRFRSQFHLVPQVDCSEAVYNRKTPPSARHT